MHHRELLSVSQSTPRSQVLHNNQLLTLGQVVEAQRSKTPVIKIAYHKVIDSPKDGAPGNFTLEKTHNVWFSPEKGAAVTEGEADTSKEAGAQQVTAARLVPTETWTSHCSSIVFAVKWLATGLWPVRAQPILTTDVDLPPGRCLALF